MYELARQKHLLLTLGKDRYMSSESGYSSFVCYAKNVTPRYTEIGLSPWQSFLFRLAKVKVLENGRIVIPQSI